LTQAILDRFGGKPRIVLASGKALFLRGGDNFSVTE
jgi:hypothetical protein